MSIMDISIEGQHIVHPIDSRYKVTEMNEIWEEENQVKQQMKIEAILSETISEMEPELIKPEEAEEIKKAIDKVELKRVKEIEAEIHHDIMAVVKAMGEKAGNSAGKIHLGATSADITETAKATLIQESTNLIIKETENFLKEIIIKAEETKNWICIDSTHGQHAVPTTYGFKLIGFADQIDTAIKRIKEDKKLIIGKISGAIGTSNSYTELELNAIELEKKVLKKLNLPVGMHSRQLPPRDNLLYTLSDLVILGNILEKLANDLWNLSRTEIKEIAEATSPKQVGSSTMPHKKNPFRLERIMGMSAILRGDLITEFELNFSHARDLKQSAPYRYRYPEMFITLDYMIKLMTNIIKYMKINKQRAYENIFLTKGSVMAERIMTELAKKGMNRQEAHKKIKQLAWKAINENKMLLELLKQEPEITNLITTKQVEQLINPETYLGTAIEKTEIILKKIKEEKKWAQ